VSTPVRQLLEDIRNELKRLRQLEEARRRAEDGTPLSRRQVSRILCIDIKSTLDPLIRKKLIKTVPWTKGEVRIPVAELRRLQREGIPVLEPKEGPLAAAGADQDADPRGRPERGGRHQEHQRSSRVVVAGGDPVDKKAPIPSRCSRGNCPLAGSGNSTMIVAPLSPSTTTCRSASPSSA